MERFGPFGCDNIGALRLCVCILQMQQTFKIFAQYAQLPDVLLKCLLRVRSTFRLHLRPRQTLQLALPVLKFLTLSFKLMSLRLYVRKPALERGSGFSLSGT